MVKLLKKKDNLKISQKRKILYLQMSNNKTDS